MEEKEREFMRIFDGAPELKAKLNAYLDSLTPEQKTENFRKFVKFVKGEITWAEIKGYPPGLLKEISRVAYWKYKKGELAQAESLFKGLSIIDHNNWYYYTALGAIYQKQKFFDRAVDEYSMALTLSENELSALINRAECYLWMNDLEAAAADLDRALAADPQRTNPLTKKALGLKTQIEKGVS